KYGAGTGQVFVETGYGLQTGPVQLEPFANLAYVNLKNNGFDENGGAAALHGNKQHTEATLSTLGLRADTSWQASKQTTLVLRGELGWQ
ncbi:autotransporter outer membrane beta-barrel domain-containing protein, partial [Rouxiella sp. Mn2063]|uniref:autotransporter outer membrane beta-barrel domain-containing protein n=1 Tax=Rouxiella sp. Mn2063 TaxID=3395262 RepID=UPI003BBF1E16